MQNIIKEGKLVNIYHTLKGKAGYMFEIETIKRVSLKVV